MWIYLTYCNLNIYLSIVQYFHNWTGNRLDLKDEVPFLFLCCIKLIYIYIMFFLHIFVNLLCT